MIKESGLWKNTDKNGKPYLKGSRGLASIIVYPNDYKQGENDPDFYLYIAEKPKQQDQQTAQAPQQQGFAAQQPVPSPPPPQQAPQQQAPQAPSPW